MRSLEDSRERWQVNTRDGTSLADLRKAVTSGGDQSPCKAGLRSVCWKTFLLFESNDVAGWSRSLIDSRSAYASLREHLLRFLENPDELGSSLDPLDDDQGSPWNTLRQDGELRAEIFQDVQRCMPEEQYFRQPETQRILLDILFVFCKINQDVGYRQGMHELLAPILWVIDQDAIDLEPLSESESSSVMSQVLDRSFVEHDAFTLFSLLMRSAKSFYELGEPEKRASTLSTGPGTPQQGESPIVERSKRIHEVYLAQLDPELANHLAIIEILPQIFLIRWIRLLFGREFPFEDLLNLWDILLCEDPGLDLVDMVCVAMLLRIRWQLLEADYSFALMLLLKYPPSVSPQTFVEDAMFLRDNFSAVGGSAIIQKHSGKSPSADSSVSRPSTPQGQFPNARSRPSKARSPLPSPAKFLQQQGGVEALFQGAAKGLFDRGERLGINKAVRDAVEEAKKNMQNLQAARLNSSARRSSEITRWSLDEGRSIPVSRVSAAAMKARNQQLASMLDHAVSDLRAVSISRDEDKDTYINAMELAIAKVDFVKIYLKDPSMPLPEDSPRSIPASPGTPATATKTISQSQQSHISPILHVVTAPDTNDVISPGSLDDQNLTRTEISESPKIPDTQAPENIPLVNDSSQGTITSNSHQGMPMRPKAPLPTRSSIAQSNFAWMLESDASSKSGTRSSPPKSSSPFLKSGRRPISGASREKAAFLFGEDEDESNGSASRLSILSDEDEGFNMGTISTGKGT